jgi:hypothetical protein
MNFPHPSCSWSKYTKSRELYKDKAFLTEGLLFLFSTEFSVVAPEDNMFIFYLTESIFFHGDVIRDIGEKGEGWPY